MRKPVRRLLNLIHTNAQGWRCTSATVEAALWDRYVDGRRLEDGFHSSAERAAARAAGVAPVPRISARERLATPEPFRDLLLDIARSSSWTSWLGHRAELIQARITEFGAVVQARGPDLREVLAEERKGARRAR